MNSTLEHGQHIRRIGLPMTWSRDVPRSMIRKKTSEEATRR